MFNVNCKAVSFGLIAMLIGSEAFAQAVRPRVRETVRTQEAVQANPSTRAGDAAVNGFKTEAQRGAPAVGQVPALRNEKGQFCSAEDFASKITKDTRVSYADALTVVQGGYVTLGSCETNTGAVLGYSADARETLLLAAIKVRNEFGGKTVFQLTQTQKNTLDNVWAQGLAEAKNRNGGNTDAASQLAVAQKIKADCNLRR